MTDLHHLLETLRQGARPPLTVDEVKLLLGWLTGSAARDGADGSGLPKPDHDPVLLQMVLFRLDATLFSEGELQLGAAGLDCEISQDQRRIRFRRLASAFHPDRFPALADWLTERSQAVHRAYARFKQDPDASLSPQPQSAPHRSPHASRQRRQDVRRAPPRVRKRRFRAFANQLRARFGNDRFLPHKLVGGLALVALLPVLNMVLVPGKETVSGFRVPVSGEKQVGAAERSGAGSVGAGSGREDSAPEPPPTGDGAGIAESGQGFVGAGSGRDGDTVSGFRVPVSGEKQVGNSADDAGESGDRGAPEDRKTSLARQAPTPVESSEPTAPPTGGASLGRFVDSFFRKDQTAKQPTTNNQQQTGEPAPGVGAGLAGEDRGPESRIATADNDATVRQSPAPETGNRKPSPPATEPEITPLLAAARRAMNPNGEVAAVAALQTVDEQLAAMGLPSDTERLYRRIHGEEEGPVGAASSRDDRGPDDESLARQAPTPLEGSGPGEDPQTGSETSTGVGAVPAGDDVAADTGEDSVGAASSRDDRGPESRIASAPTETAETSQPARKPQTGNPKPAPAAAPSAQDAPPAEGASLGRFVNSSFREDQTTNQPTTNNLQQTGDPANQRTGGAAPEAHDDSELALGPLATHPAGEVLKRLHAALADGNIPGVADSFARDARMDSLRGREEIADHFRPALNPADSRRVKLKVLRLGREDDGWRVEADLDVRVQRDASTHTLVTGRSSFWLAERGDRLLITRMELE